MGAVGKPVRARTAGFANDIGALNRLRTALSLDPTLSRDGVAKAKMHVDQLIDALGALHAVKLTQMAETERRRA